MIQEFCNVPLEQVRVLYAGAGKFKIDDQGGKEGGAPFGLMHDQAEPYPDIAQMGRVNYGLPVSGHSNNIGMLKTKASGLPQEGLNEPAVAPVKDLGSRDLDALQ